MLIKYDNSLILNIKDSRSLIAILVMQHLGAAVLLLATPLPWFVRVALWVTLAVSGYRSVVRHGLRRGAGAIVGLRLNADDACEIQFAGIDAWHSCRLVDSWVHPWVVIARLRYDPRGLSVGVVIPWDAVDPELFRQLRIRLRLRRVAA